MPHPGHQALLLRQGQGVEVSTQDPQRRASDEYREGCAEARRAFLIGQAVRERRLAPPAARRHVPQRLYRVCMPSACLEVRSSP